jgi:xanthine phosphoribosyltransferase
LEELRRRIQTEGKNLGKGILKVDSFINHQIDPGLMVHVGQEMARRFTDVEITKVLTAEISGIAPALATGQALDVPVVYARKTRPVTMTGPVFVEIAPSHTKGRDVFLMVSTEFLGPGDRVLVVDDFLATGATILALVRLVQHAEAELVGIGTVIEKAFEGGRAGLEALGVPIVSLAVVSDMSDGQINLSCRNQANPS